MDRNNNTQANPSRTIKARTAPIKPMTISKSEVRRSTYGPGRPAGVHAREVGLKRS